MTGAADFRIELVTRRDEVPLGAEQWNALVAANETNTVFQTREWFDAWWSSFGHGKRLFLLLVRDHDAIVGFAALMLARGALGWRELRFVGAGNADYQDFVLPHDKPRALEAVCRFLCKHRWRWDRLALGNVPAQSSTLALLGSLGAKLGLYQVDEAQFSCPTMLLRADPGHARQMIEKYSVRRPYNWFSKRGTVSFRHVSSLDDVLRMLPVFFEQHRQRWQMAGKSSQFSQPRQCEFYAALARTLHGRGWLQFSVVELDGAPLAFHFGFDYAGSITWYKPSFDVRYAEHSPGLMLTRKLISDALNRDRIELDFTGGEESFKGRFANHLRHNRFVGVYPRRVSWLTAIAVRGMRRLAGRSLRRLRGGTQRVTKSQALVPTVDNVS